MSLLASNWLPTTSYRVVDPIENLRLQVTLRKRGTQGAVSYTHLTLPTILLV